MWTFTESSGRGFGRWVIWLRHGPPWPLKWAIFCGFAAMVVPLAVLALLGLVVGFAVFVVLSIIDRIGGLFRGGKAGSPGDEAGRSNVRVID